jgi:type IX secretion system PorP/SprF family membrane protein
MMRTALTLFIFLAFLLPTKGQEIHLTGYERLPTYINPAETGAFYGTFRIGAIYRDQWRSALNAYQTGGLQIDLPFSRGFRERDWIGLGMNIFSDQAGNFGLTTTGIQAAVAYHLGLDKKGKNTLALGIQSGYLQKRIAKPDGDRFGDGIAAEQKGSPYATLDGVILTDSDPKGAADVNAGIVFKSTLNNRLRYSLGFSLSHIAKTRITISGTTRSETLDPKYVVHTQWDYALNKTNIVSPSLLFYKMGSAEMLLLRVNNAWLINKEKGMQVLYGAGMRWGDSFNLMMGFRYKGWDAGIAYDVNYSPFIAATKSVGAIEIGVTRIFNIYKRPKYDPVIFCPRF